MPIIFIVCCAVDRGLRSQLHAVRDQEEVAALHEHQEHDSQALRRQVQGHLRGGLPKVRTAVCSALLGATCTVSCNDRVSS